MTSLSTELGRQRAGSPASIAERQVDAAQKLYGAMGLQRRDLVGRKMAYICKCTLSFDAPPPVFIFMPEPFDTREATERRRHVRADVDAGADGAGHRVLPHRARYADVTHKATRPDGTDRLRRRLPPGRSASIQRASAE